MTKRKRPKQFSVIKAVKSNARDRLGTPPPGHPLPDDKAKAEHRAAKHKVTLTRLLQQEDAPAKP